MEVWNRHQLDLGNYIQCSYTISLETSFFPSKVHLSEALLSLPFRTWRLSQPGVIKLNTASQPINQARAHTTPLYSVEAIKQYLGESCKANGDGEASRGRRNSSDVRIPARARLSLRHGRAAPEHGGHIHAVRGYRAAPARAAISPMVTKGKTDGSSGIVEWRCVPRMGTPAYLARAVRPRAEGATAHPFPRVPAPARRRATALKPRPCADHHPW